MQRPLSLTGSSLKASACQIAVPENHPAQRIVTTKPWHILGMGASGRRSVGLRELRHNTSAVLSRVRHGETVDVTEYGRLVARIVPVEERKPAPVLDRLVSVGRLQPATRPGYRPRMRPGGGTDRLGEALAELRAEER